MAHELRCLHRFETLHRMVFNNAVNEGARAAGGDRLDELVKKAVPEGAQEVLDKAREEQEARQAQRDTTEVMTYDLASQIEEKEAQNEAEGTPDDYFNKFKMSPKLDFIHSQMRAGRACEGSGNGSLNNFTLWRAKRTEIVRLFDEQNGKVFMPRGKGREAFIKGLKAEEGTPEWEASDAVLKKIIATLQERLDVQNKAEAALRHQRETPLTGHTLDGYWNNFKNSWNRAGTAESTLIVGAIGAILYWAWGKKDSKLPGATDTTYGDAALLGGVFAGVNLLFGACSPNGKTLLNHAGTGSDAGVPDISDPFMRNYAYMKGMDKNKNKLNAMTTTMDLDIKQLYRLYRDAIKLDSTERKIDITRLHLAPGVIDGHALYEVIDEVVKKTAKNRIKMQYMHDKGITEESHINDGELQQQYNEKLNYVDADGKERDDIPNDQVLAYFEDKYLSGPVSRSQQTLVQAIVNENYEPATDYELAVKPYDDEELLSKVKNGTKAAAIATYDYFKNTAIPNVIEVGGDFIGYMDDNVVTPLGAAIKRNYNEYEPKVTGFLRNKLAAWKQGDVEKVVDANLNATVTEYSIKSGKGVVTIKGVPGFELEAKKDDKNVETLIIDGVPFDPKKDVKGNAESSKKLDAAASKKALSLFTEATKEKDKGFLKGKDIAWNPGKGVWYIDNVDLPQYQENGVIFASKQAKVEMTITKENVPQFVVNGRPLEEFEGDLAKSNLETMLEQRIKDETTYREIEGLPVKITSVEKDGASHKLRVTIGGLTAVMIPRDGNDVTKKLQFLDEATGTKGGLEMLKITPENNGVEFLRQKSEQILTSRKFLDPFLGLESLLNNTKEGLWSRAADGSLSGPIKDRKWKYILDLKKAEALQLYQFQLAEGKTAAHMDDAYKSIDVIIKQVAVIENQLRGLAPDLRIKKFDEYMPELEKVGYTQIEYREMFNKYKAMIAKYDLGGSESWENSLIDLTSDRYKVYQELMWMWSMNTRAFMTQDPETGSVETLSQKSKDYLQINVIDVIDQKLSRVAEGNKLTLENLKPRPTDSIESAEEWIK